MDVAVLHIEGKHSWLKHLDFILIDLLTLAGCFIVSYWLKFRVGDFFVNEVWTRLLIIVTLVDLLLILVVNPYSGIFRRTYYQEIGHSLQMAAFNLIAIGVLLYLFKWGELYSREVLLDTYFSYFIVSTLLKWAWKKLLLSRRVVLQSTRQLPLFVLCERSSLSETLTNVASGDFQLYDIQAASFADGGAGGAPGGVPIIEGDFVQYVLEQNIGDVLIAVPPGLVEVDAFRRLAANGVRVHFNVEAIIGFQTEDHFVANVGVYRTLSVSEFAFSPGQVFYLGVKRCFDVLCGLIGLVIFVPVAVGVKIAYLLSGDRANIIYRQKRVGLNGREIDIYKFRSMVPDAESRLNDLLAQAHYRQEWEENQKFEDDPRITKVGRFIRRTSIDELPQLINVLKGEMSLVGPRPLVQGELEAHNGLKLYQKVKPGITGWWGCNGRNNIDYRERLELEYYYVKHCSLYLDMLCVFRTIFAIIKRDGAQ